MSEARDRELDARIAERITGWKPLDDKSDGWVSPDGKVKHWNGPMEYSVNIAAAMEVLSHADVYHITRSNLAKPEEEFEVMVGFPPLRHRSRLRTATVGAASLPRAICLAALAAIGEETR